MAYSNPIDNPHNPGLDRRDIVMNHFPWTDFLAYEITETCRQRGMPHQATSDAASCFLQLQESFMNPLSMLLQWYVPQANLAYQMRLLETIHAVLLLPLGLHMS